MSGYPKSSGSYRGGGGPRGRGRAREFQQYYQQYNHHGQGPPPGGFPGYNVTGPPPPPSHWVNNMPPPGPQYNPAAGHCDQTNYYGQQQHQYHEGQNVAGVQQSQQGGGGRRSQSGERRNDGPQSRGGSENTSVAGGSDSQSAEGEGSRPDQRDRSRSGDRGRSHSGGRQGGGDRGQGRNGNRDRSWSGDRQGQQNFRGKQTRWEPKDQGGYQRQGSHDNYDQNYGRQNYHGGQGNWNNSGNRQGGQGRREQDNLVFLSKTLSSILRHNAEKFGFKLMKGGFLYVNDILTKVHKLRAFTLEDIQYVVDTNDKKRFTLETEPDGRVKIRANQGHSLEVEELDLKPILSADDFPRVIHGTYYAAWEAIKHTGLCRMKRNHMHFAAGEPGNDGVISGMRSSCEVMIYIDLEKALKDGLKFFLSANNVILCSGNEDGYLFPCYFMGAKDRRKGHRLEFDSSISFLKRPSVPGESGSPDKKSKRNKNRNKNQDHWPTVEAPAENKPKQKPDKASVEPAEDILANTNDMFAEVPDQWDASKEVAQKREEPPVKQVEEPPKKKDVPEWDPSPTFIEDIEESKSAVDYILSQSQPPTVAVCCCGHGLGTEDSDIRTMVILAKPKILFYHLQDSQKTLMTEGDLKDILMSRDIKKIFHNIGSVSVSLIQEFDMLMNGVPIMDIGLVCDKVTLSGIEKEKLQDKYKIKLSDLKKQTKAWEIENDDLVKKLGSSETSGEAVYTLVQRGKLMLDLYDICSSSFSTDLERKLKKEVFELAIPSKKDHFLAEKIAALKEAAKKANKGKQGEEKKDGAQGSSSPGQQQQGGNKQQNQKKGGNKKKNKK